MYADLRAFIGAVDDADDLLRLDGADWHLEIGAITEVVAERDAGPALLFDDVAGYPQGYRILTNPFGSVTRTKMALNREGVDGALDVLDAWRRDFTGYSPIAPRTVETSEAPARENVNTGDDVDVTAFPVPKWHEHDGGRYIGTGCTVITEDPETGWVNLGVYRSYIIDESAVSMLFIPGKDGRIIMQKYHERGEACPVAMVLGTDPHTWIASTLTANRQEGEYGIAGWIRDEPVPVVESEFTGLPVPANAEVVLEGCIPPLEERSCVDGPFGEWPGYATDPSEDVPVMEVDVVSHRDDPVLLGQPPLRPPAKYYEIPIRTAGGVWNQLEGAGLAGITGVWVHVFERPMFMTISVNQQYPGHAKQVATAAVSMPNGVYGGRYVVVVDDDVDITDTKEVLWALCSRCDVEDIDIVRDLYTSPLDPVTGAGESTSSRMVMNACRPYGERESFPPVNRASDELRESVIADWDLGDL